MNDNGALVTDFAENPRIDREVARAGHPGVPEGCPQPVRKGTVAAPALPAGDPLEELLGSLGAAALGEGDAGAGANVLAAMALTLANLRPPRGAWAGDREARVALGVSTMVSGPSSAALVDEKVIRPLEAFQDGLTAALRDLGPRLGPDQATARLFGDPPGSRPGQFLGVPGRGMDTGDLRDESLVTAFGRCPADGADATHPLNLVLLSSGPVTYGDLHGRPLLFVNATRPKEIRRRLARSHLGRPLVRMAVVNAGDFACLGEIAVPLMDGGTGADEEGTTIRGTVILSDPCRAVGEVDPDETPDARWIARLLWLVDGGAGPVLSVEDAAPARVDTEACFGRALGVAWVNRLHGAATGGRNDLALLDEGFATAQVSWMTFLAGHEEAMPGITLAARPLLASLWFGLGKIAAEHPPTGTFRVTAGQASAFARHLVERMLNAAAVMRAAGHRETRRKRAAGIMDRLAPEPLTAREITRRFHRLPLCECRGLLAELEETGKVVRMSGGRWALVGTAPEPAGLLLQA